MFPGVEEEESRHDLGEDERYVSERAKKRHESVE
jgi:hypothetical protein